MSTTEQALNEALARVEELEALLYKRIQAQYISENEYINKGAVYLRRIRKSCREALQHAGEEGFQSGVELRIRLKVLNDLLEIFKKRAI